MITRPIYNIESGVDQTKHHWFENSFDEVKLDWINNLVELYPLESATTIGGEKEYRNSSVRWLYYDQFSAWVYDDLGALIMEANKSWKFDLYSVIDSIQYTEYNESGGHYDWHVDIGPSIAHRKISIVTQLSDPDEYEGGDLQIWAGGEYKTVPKSKGGSVVFPSFLMHRVTPVTKGIRKSLVLWVGGGSYK